MCEDKIINYHKKKIMILSLDAINDGIGAENWVRAKYFCAPVHSYKNL